MTTKTPPVVAPQDTYEYLRRALQLLEAPRAGNPQAPCNSWIKGREAVDINGNSCSPESDLAVAYCEIGAVRAVTHYASDDPVVRAATYNYVLSILQAANPMAINAGSVPSVNDNPDTEFSRVQRMFHKAMAFVEKMK